MSAGRPAVAEVGDGVGLDGPLVGAGSGAGWLPCRRVLRVALGPVAGLAVAAMVLRFGASWSSPAMGVWAAGLVALAGTDADRMVLPTRLVYLTLAKPSAV